MPDGSPPPFTAGIERICSDAAGSAPGPITDKKGEYLWRMDVDPLRSRACFIRATHPGYTARAQALPGRAIRGEDGMTTDRERALRECSEIANKLVQKDWGVHQDTTMGSCMTSHGQIP